MLLRGTLMREAFITLCALNVADAVLTAVIIATGTGSESNPLMRAAWDWSPVAFFAVKVLLVTACGAALVHAKAAKTLRILCVVLAAVVAFSAFGLARCR